MQNSSLTIRALHAKKQTVQRHTSASHEEGVRSQLTAFIQSNLRVKGGFHVRAFCGGLRTSCGPLRLIADSFPAAQMLTYAHKGEDCFEMSCCIQIGI